MSSLRVRIAAFSLVLFAAAVCFSLPPAGIVTADDATQNKSSDQGKSDAAGAKDQAADAQNAAPADAGKRKSTAKKPRKPAAKKPKPATKKKAPSKNAGKPAAGNTNNALPQGNGGQRGMNGGRGGLGALGAAALGGGGGIGGAGGLGAGGAAGAGGGGRGIIPGAAPQNNGGPDPKEVERVMAVQNKHTANLLKQPEVVGTSTALAKDGSVVLKVYTTFAGNRNLPKQIDGVNVVVSESGNFRFQDGEFDPKLRADRPVPIGVSAAPQDSSCTIDLNCYSGTLGCRLKPRNGDPSVYALSNNHVFANLNNYSPGKPIMQPSPGEDTVLCACIKDDQIGTLYKFKTIDFTGQPNLIDAAIMLTSDKLVDNSTPPGGYGKPRTTIVQNPVLGMRVQKYGRTTGHTNGQIVALNQVLTIADAQGTAVFINTIEIVGDDGSIFSNHGDSGSLIVTDDRFPVALLFAGAEDASSTSGIPIKAVLDYFEMDIDGDDSQDFIPPGKIGSSTAN
jgi:hypothetical protein